MQWSLIILVNNFLRHTKPNCGDPTDVPATSHFLQITMNNCNRPLERFAGKKGMFFIDDNDVAVRQALILKGGGACVAGCTHGPSRRPNIQAYHGRGISTALQRRRTIQQDTDGHADRYRGCWSSASPGCHFSKCAHSVLVSIAQHLSWIQWS